MSTDGIDISDLDEAEVIAALHNNTRCLGMGMLHDVGRLTADAVRAELKDAPRNNGMLRFDYYHGRPLKLAIGAGKINHLGLYDRDAGDGVGARVLAELRAGTTRKKERVEP